LGRRNVDIVRSGKVVIQGRPEKTKPVLENFKNSLSSDRPVFIRLRLQKGKDQILFPKVDCPFYMELLGHLGQFRNTFLFQFRKIHKNLSPIRINLKQERRTDSYRSGTNAVPLSQNNDGKRLKDFYPLLRRTFPSRVFCPE
jgi:hypothetical protein